MRKKSFIKSLTIISIAVLAGIIALQVYWILTSYQQQKSRFQTDIQNALSAANIKTTLKKAFNKDNKGLASAIDVNNLISAIENIGSYRKKSSNRMTAMLLSNSSVRVKDSSALSNYLKKGEGSYKVRVVDSIKFKISDEDFKSYKSAYQKELISREIYIPFELAVVDNSGHIGWSSCDSNLFRDIPFKSNIDEFSQVKSKVVWGLQAAFPGGNFYLLRKMTWIFSLSILLILIGSYSLGYLFIFFFAQKKLSDLRNDFMNNMAHELKTPISAVSIALEMALSTNKNLSADKKNAYLVIAQKEIKRLDLLAETILKILSVEKAEIQILKTHIQLLPWLQSIINSISPLLDDKNVKVSVKVLPETLELFADSTHLVNVLYNLLENAVKYNNKLKPEIEIKATLYEDQLFLEISDNGEGIPAQYINNVFDKFFRVPKGDRHDVKGYGLGLSYVKAIVELHQGSVTVSSILDTGTTFTIKLPIK